MDWWKDDLVSSPLPYWMTSPGEKGTPVVPLRARPGPHTVGVHGATAGQELEGPRAKVTFQGCLLGPTGGWQGDRWPQAWYFQCRLGVHTSQEFFQKGLWEDRGGCQRARWETSPVFPRLEICATW